MALMRDLNQYLQKRGDRWHYVRRVPTVYQVCPAPLKLDHLLLSNFDGKGYGYGEETVFR